MFKYLSTKNLQMGRELTAQFDGVFVSETQATSY